MIQLPTDEFFNTGIHIYLWVLNKAKDTQRKDKLMMIDASQKFKPLKKNKGAKRREVDERSRQEIVAALATLGDNDFARVFDRAFFYYNKQAIQLTNVDATGHSFAEQLKDEQKSLKLHPAKISTPARGLAEFPVTSFDPNRYTSLLARFEREIAPFVSGLDSKEQALVAETKKERYWCDTEREMLVKEGDGKQTALGCGRIVVKYSLLHFISALTVSFHLSVSICQFPSVSFRLVLLHFNHHCCTTGCNACIGCALQERGRLC